MVGVCSNWWIVFLVVCSCWLIRFLLNFLVVGVGVCCWFRCWLLSWICCCLMN